MNVRRSLRLVVLTLAVVLGAGTRSAFSQTELTTLRIASTPIDVGAEVYYAQALGFFKQAGLDVQIQRIENGAAIAAAVAGGAADIGQSNVVSLATAPYSSAKDLENKTLVTNGLLKLASGSFRILASPYDAIGKHWQIGAWFATREWASQHPDTVKRFVAVMRRTARWANAHKEESLKILGEVSKVTYPQSMHRAVYAEQLEPALFQPVIDNSAKYGAISAPFPAAELF